jgi:hypothetical protein
LNADSGVDKWETWAGEIIKFTSKVVVEGQEAAHSHVRIAVCHASCAEIRHAVPCW